MLELNNKCFYPMYLQRSISKIEEGMQEGGMDQWTQLFMLLMNIMSLDLHKVN